MRLGRRRLLAGFSVLPMTRLARAASFDVIVVGAGMAGLAAARQLRAEGIAVTILEARDRIGGRTHTGALWPDLPVDLGAAWIHGIEGNPVTKLAQEAGATLAMTESENVLERGSRIEESDDNAFDAAIDGALKAANRLDEDVSIAEALQRHKPAAALLKAKGTALRRYIASNIEHEFAGDMETLSAWSYDNGELFDGDDALIAEGYGYIVRYLSRGLDIRLNSVVTRISHDDDGVSIQTASGIMTAKAAIVTVPLGVLKAGTIAFDPPLPSSHAQAIAGLGFGVYDKCVLRFAEAFWPKDTDWISNISDQPRLWTEFYSLSRVFDAPVLVGFMAGSAAVEIEKLSDEATIASAMTALRGMFGEGLPEPVSAQITRWATDPFARGSYSFNAVGTSAKTRRALAAPIGGTLIFAGEACSPDYHSTVHGAWLSGQDAATAIAAMIKAQ